MSIGNKTDQFLAEKDSIFTNSTMEIIAKIVLIIINFDGDLFLHLQR